MSLRVFIGWDSREAECADVLAYSLREHASVPLDTIERVVGSVRDKTTECAGVVADVVEQRPGEGRAPPPEKVENRRQLQHLLQQWHNDIDDATGERVELLVRATGAPGTRAVLRALPYDRYIPQMRPSTWNTARDLLYLGFQYPK
jgi:hypothetical protein